MRTHIHTAYTAYYNVALIPWPVLHLWFGHSLVQTINTILHNCTGFSLLVSLYVYEYVYVFKKVVRFTVLPERDYVTFGSLLSQFLTSSVCLSVVCNVGAPYSDGWTFRRNFFTAVYAGHPLTSVQNFTEVVPGLSLIHISEPTRPY